MALSGLNRLCRIICKTIWALKIYEQIYADIYGSRESMRVSAESMDLLLPVNDGDTRILLHTINLAESRSEIIVRCDDTDVFVLLLYCGGKDMFGDPRCSFQNWSN